MKIAIAGTGYVGLSIATLLSQKNEVVALDVIPEKVELINNRKSPIHDKKIEEFFETKKLNLKATLDYREAFYGAEFIIISTPTNYDDVTNSFDTSSVEDIIQKVISMNINTTMVVKSTIPVGFIESVKVKYNIDNIMFSPEFLREGKALYDNLYPSRIIVGEKSVRAEKFANLLKEAALKDNTELSSTFSTEIIPDYNTGFMNLESGAVDAVAMDIVVAKYQIESRSAEFKILDYEIASEQYGVGFAKGNDAVKDQVQKTLEEMAADGTLAKISTKWFGEDITTIGK